MSRQHMSQWGAHEAERLIMTGRVKEMSIIVAISIVSGGTKVESSNGWSGLPEGEMVGEYLSNRLLVAKYVVWCHETIRDAVANLS